MDPIKLPKGSEKYIGLQRLETQLLGSTIHYKGFGQVLYNIYDAIPFAKSIYKNYSTNLEPKIRRKKIYKQYSEVMQREFNTLKNHIPDNPSVVLGIGTGVAGLEAFISKHYQSQQTSLPHIIIVDKTGVDPIHFGFQEKAAIYNSLNISKQTLLLNGHEEDKISLTDSDDAEILREQYAGQVDLVTSLIAWGFHFPVSTYLDLVYDLLTDGGRLIIDVRKGTDGHETIKRKFGQTSLILDDEKFERILAVKL